MMSNIVWKYGNDCVYTLNSNLQPNRLRGFAYDLLCGNYDFEYTNIETICKLYNFITTKGIRLCKSLHEYIRAFLAYQQAYKMVDTRCSKIGSDCDHFYYIAEAFLNRDGVVPLTDEEILIILLKIAINRQSLYYVIYYNKLLNNKYDDVIELTMSNVKGRLDTFINKYSLSLETIISFSKKYPYIMIGEIGDIIRDEDTKSYKFLSSDTIILGEVYDFEITTI